jgi:DNA-binding MarR family transcriptional regulator
MEDVRELLQLFVRRFGLLNASCCDLCCGQEISLVQSHIIYEINRQSNPSMQQVAEALGMDITTFSRQIKTLENRELVIKAPNLDDRRIYNLSLTNKGLEIEKNISVFMSNYLNEVFGQFTDLERDLVLKSIKLLNQALVKSGACCK